MEAPEPLEAEDDADDVPEEDDVPVVVAGAPPIPDPELAPELELESAVDEPVEDEALAPPDPPAPPVPEEEDEDAVELEEADEDDDELDDEDELEDEDEDELDDVPGSSQVPALHMPATPQVVPSASLPSKPQLGFEPSHDSAVSQSSTLGRQTTEEDATASAGQKRLAPSHASATSQSPADARQTTPAAWTCPSHVALAPVSPEHVDCA